MNMRLKYLLIGLIVGTILATAGTSLAAPTLEKVTATIRADFGLKIDGESVQLENAPLAYNGTSYLPVRELSTLLGKEVDFKDGTITLSTKEDDNLETTTTEWITLNQAAPLYDLYIEVGPEYMKIGELTFERPDGRYNGIVEIETGNGILLIKISNGLFLLNPDNLDSLGISQ